MKKAEIKVGGLYTARVGGRFTTVRVDSIGLGGLGSRQVTSYAVTNLSTGRKTVFQSAAKFRSETTLTDDHETTYEGAAQKIAAEKAKVGYHGEEADPLRPTEAPKEEGASEEADPTSANIAGNIVVQHTADAAKYAAVTSAEYARNVDDNVTSSLNVAEDVSSRLAARITASRQVRAAGTPVAGMVPNAEQESIIALAASGPRVMVVGAGAGTGKTATLKMLEQVLPGNGQYTAFNASLVAESKTKFTKAACNTTHSLAFRAVGRLYQHRLGGERVKSWQVARMLGVEAMNVVLKGMGVPDKDGKPTDKVKTLGADFLAGQVIVAVRKFCQSADRAINTTHLRTIDGIDAVGDDGKRERANADRVHVYLLPFCEAAWADMSRVDGQLPFTHDCYVKIWQLGQGQDRPVIAADYILLDEAQDTAPVFLDILRQQGHTMLVLVGDSNQAIYEWRGAVDAMRAYPDAERRLLSQSYRFGQAVADVANAVLATLEEPTDLVMRGMPTIPSRVAEVAEPRCYLYRTNAGALSRVMSAVAEGKRPHLVGGKDYVSGLTKWCEAAVELQANRKTRHPELTCFDTWVEVVEYSKTDEGEDLRLMVKLVEEFGAAEIARALKNMPTEPGADLVISTAHKSKGREWDTVKLGPDFPTANKMGDPDRRLLYVAATRAKHVLDVSECPPFCGGQDQAWGEGGAEARWVPGIEDDLEAYYIQRASGLPTTAQTPPNGVSAPPGELPPAVAAPSAANGNGGAGGEFSWANMDGGWCVRGPEGAEIGARVTVVRKNGSRSEVTLRSVTRKIRDFWFYGV